MPNAETGQRVYAAPTTGYVVDADGVILEVKRAVISTSSSGATSEVAAVSGKKIRVLSAMLIANGAVNVKFQSASTDITGLFYLAANGGVGISFSPVGHFETAVNEALNINLSGAVAVGGFLTYVEA